MIYGERTFLKQGSLSKAPAKPVPALSPKTSWAMPADLRPTDIADSSEGTLNCKKSNWEVREPWEGPALRYVDERFGRVEKVRRPEDDPACPADARVDILAETAGGKVAVEGVRFNVDKTVEDEMYRHKAELCLLPEPTGFYVCTSRRGLLGAARIKPRQLAEVSSLVREAAKELVVIADEEDADEEERSAEVSRAIWERIDAIEEGSELGPDRPLDVRIAKTVQWGSKGEEHLVVVRRLPDEEPSCLTVFSGEDAGEIDQSYRNVFGKHLPKVLRAAEVFGAIPVLAVEAPANQSEAGTAIIGEYLAPALAQQELPPGFHCITLAAWVRNWTSICVIWDDDGNTMEPRDRDRFRWAFDRMKKEKRGG